MQSLEDFINDWTGEALLRVLAASQRAILAEPTEPPWVDAKPGSDEKGRAVSKRDIRYHSSEDMADLRELMGVSEPVAVVIRRDGSYDVYGYVAVVDQTADQDLASQGQDCQASHCPPGPDGRCAWPRCAE